jgi:hypothetical protein
VKNGAHAEVQPAARFEPRFGSRVPGWLEGVVVAAVFALIAAILWLVAQTPGPLVVHVQDDAKAPVVDARVRCDGPDGKEFTGLTDVFGEAKWPGLAKGAWRCEVVPPARWFASPVVGYATVVARKPAVWIATIERPARALVTVVRPQGAVRAAVAVRAVCEKRADDPFALAWESRAGILDERATLWLPPGHACRVGLVRPELPRMNPGAPSDATLSCDVAPCSGELRAGVGDQVDVTLRPTSRQWQAVRPAPESDDERQ